MARPMLVLVIALVALVAYASADAASEAADAAVPAFGPASDDQIGTTDDENSAAQSEGAPTEAATEAPVGGPAPPGAFPDTPESSSYGGAAALQASAAVAAAVAVAGCFF